MKMVCVPASPIEGLLPPDRHCSFPVPLERRWRLFIIHTGKFIGIASGFKAELPDKIERSCIGENRGGKPAAGLDIFMGQVLFIDAHCYCRRFRGDLNNGIGDLSVNFIAFIRPTTCKP